ncbi:hypothetical protein V8B55DRAFT_1441108 [Mucor lusitanicus]
MSKSPSHQSRYPCKDCCQETEHAHNRNHGLYLPYKPQSSNGSAARLRTKQDYQEGDPAHGIHSLSLLSGMKLFNGSLVFNWLQPRTPSFTTRPNQTEPDTETYNVEGYPFMIPKAKLLVIGQRIEESRQHIPNLFLGSCRNHIFNRKGMRSVNLIDILTQSTATLFIPQLESVATQQALLQLIKACTIAMSWSVTEEELQEMDRCFVSFFTFCKEQIQARNLSATVYRPVLHAACHFSAAIRNNESLPVASTRSIERSIGAFKRKLTGKIASQAQPNNLVEKTMVRSLLNHSLDVEEEANLITPEEHNGDDDDELTVNYSSDRQLWLPFENVVLNDDEVHYEGVKVSAIRKAFGKFYQRVHSDSTIRINGPVVYKLAGRAWLTNKVVLSSVYQANKSREHRRANHYVFFTSPFKRRDVTIEACKPFEAKTFFLAFVKLMQGHGRATHSQDIPEVVLPGTQESCRYAIISIDRDIQYQVGLVKNFVGESRKCAVITPHDRFDCAMLCHCRQLANIEDYIGITSIVSSQTLPTSLLAVINSFSFFLPVRFKSSIQAYSIS